MSRRSALGAIGNYQLGPGAPQNPVLSLSKCLHSESYSEMCKAGEGQVHICHKLELQTSLRNILGSPKPLKVCCLIVVILHALLFWHIPSLLLHPRPVSCYSELWQQQDGGGGCCTVTKCSQKFSKYICDVIEQDFSVPQDIIAVFWEAIGWNSITLTVYWLNLKMENKDRSARGCVIFKWTIK